MRERERECVVVVVGSKTPGNDRGSILGALARVHGRWFSTYCQPSRAHPGKAGTDCLQFSYLGNFQLSAAESGGLTGLASVSWSRSSP